MADELRLNMDVNTTKSKTNIDELNRSLEKVESTLQDINRYSQQGGMENLPTQDLNRLVSSMLDAQRKLASTYTGVNSRGERLQRPEGQSTSEYQQLRQDNIREMNQLRRDLTDQVGKILGDYAEANNEGSVRFFANDPGRHDTDPSTSSQALRSAQNTQRILQNELTRTERQLKSAFSSDGITDYQARLTKEGINRLLGEYQGARTPEDIEAVRQYDGTGEPTWFVDDNSMRGQLERQKDSLDTEWVTLSEQRQGIQSQLEEIEGKDGAVYDQQRTILESSLDKVEEEMQDNQRAVDRLQDTMETLNDAITRLTGLMGDEEDPDRYIREIEVKPNRDTFAGFFDSRRDTIGLATINALANSMESAMQSGMSVTERQRPDSLTIGTSLGTNDFRGLREEARNFGKTARVSGEEMLENADSYMRHIGIDPSQPEEQTREDLFEASEAISTGQRTTGVSNEQWQALTGVTLESGATDTPADLLGLQEAFIGAIEISGMAGREKEQVDALTALLDQVSASGGLTDDQMRNQVAMATLLSSTGIRALQGQNLQDNLGGLNEAIQGADMFSDIGFMMGVGTDPQFSGPAGMLNFEKAIKEGFASPEGMDLINNLVAFSGGNTEYAAGLLASELGMDPYAAEEITNLSAQGQLNMENLERIMAQAEETGEGEREDRLEAYEYSEDADQEGIQVNREDINANVRENPITAFFDNLMAGFTNMMSSTWGTSMVFAGGAALGGGINTLLRNAAGRGIGETIRTFTRGKMGDVGQSIAGSSAGKTILDSDLFQRASNSRVGQWFQGTKIGGKFSSWFGLGDDVVDGAATAASTTSKASKAASTAADAATDSAKSGGWFDDVLKYVDDILPTSSSTLGKVLGGVGKALPWIDGAIQTYQGVDTIREAEDDEKGETTGRVIGEVIGNVGGGALGGAALGSFFGPLGTFLGAVGGSLLGEKALGSTGGWVGGFFDSDEEEQEDESGVGSAASDPNAMGNQYAQATNPESPDGYAETLATATTQDEQRIANQRLTTEELRSENAEYEDTNLSRLQQLLKEMRSILAQARTLMSGAGTGDISMTGSGVGGELQYTETGEYWTNPDDLAQHDLAYTTNTLTADQLNDWINTTAPENSIMRGMGEAFMEAGRQSGLDPRYLVGHAAHETAWGTSQIALDKGNMYGIGAFDASPYASAYGYDNTEAGIIEGANWIAENYYQGRGATTLDAMNVDYATDPAWADKIAGVMRGSEQYTQPSQVHVETNVTVQGGRGGNDQETGENVGRAASNHIVSTINEIWTTDMSHA